MITSSEACAVFSILRQNKKIALLQFLFGSQDSIAEPGTQNHLNEKIERLQNQVNFLQQKVIQLEQNQRLDLEHERLERGKFHYFGKDSRRTED